MANVNANINVNVNSQQALAQIKALQSQISAFNKSVVASNASAVAAQKSLNSTLAAQIGASRAFSTSMTTVETGVGRLQTAIDKNKLSMGEYFKYGAASSKTFGRIFKKEHMEMTALATERVKRLQTQYLALGQAQNGMTKAMAVRPMGLFNADMAIGIQRQQLFNKLLTDGSTSIINWGKNTQWAGRQLMVGFTIPLTIFGAAASKVFMDLEKEAINFKKVYGDIFTTETEVEANLDAVKELSVEMTKYGIAVKDTMALAGVAAQAGLRSQDLMEATTQATRLAVLGQMEQAEAMRTVISMQTAFQQSNEELGESVDFLNIIENQTVLSLQDVAGAIPRVAPVIKGMGGDVKDLAVLLVAMREGGVSAAEGANALKNSLARLVDPTSRAIKVANEFGINLEGIVEKNRGEVLPTILELAQALGSLEGPDEQKLLATIFGKFQYARIGALMKNIRDDSSQAARAMDLMGMSAQDLAKTAEQELGVVENAVSTKFVAAMEKAKVAIAPIGEIFLKVATPLLEVISKLFDRFNDLSPTVKNFIAILVGGIGVAAPAIIMIVGLFGNLIGNGLKIIATLGRLLSRMKGTGDGAKYLSGAQLDAAAAASSLEGRTTRLTGSLNVQRSAVNALTAAYRGYVVSAQSAAASLPQGFRGVAPVAPRRMARGGMVGGTGNKDTEPALLTPGEFVINANASKTFAPILAAMNEGKIGQYARGRNPSIYGGQEVILGPAGMLAPGNVAGGFGMSREFFSVGKGFEESLRATAIATSGMENGIKLTEKAVVSMSDEIQPFTSKITEHLRQTEAAMKASGRDARHISEVFKEAKPGMDKIFADMRKVGTTTAGAAEGVRKLAYPTEADYRAEGERRVPAAVISQSGRSRTTEYRSRQAASMSRTRGVFGKLFGRPEKGMTMAHVTPEDQKILGDVVPLKGKGVGLSPESTAKERAYIVKKSEENARIYGKTFSETLAKSDSTAKGLASETSRRSPTKQAILNGKQDAQGYARSYKINLDNELARRVSGTFPGMKAPVGPVSVLPGAGGGAGGGRGGPTFLGMPGMGPDGGGLGASAAAAAQEMGKTRKLLSKFGSGLVRGSAGLSSVTMGLSGLAFGLSFMEGSIGETAQKIMPVAFGLTALQQVLPMLATKFGAVALPLAASAGAIWFLKSKSDEMGAEMQKMANSLIATRSVIDEVGKFYGKQSVVARQEADIIKERTGVVSEDLQKAQEFLATNVGVKMQEGLSMAMTKFGATNTAKQFSANLASMILQGVISPKEAKAIAVSVGKAMGNEKFGIDVAGKLTTLLGPKNRNLLKTPLRLAIEIDRQSAQTVGLLSENATELSDQFSGFMQTTRGDLAANFIPVFNVINAINKATLDWDNVIGRVARSARGILNPDDFETSISSLKLIGSVVGNQLAQSYDNLSAAKARYEKASKKAKEADDQDEKSKQRLKKRAKEAKEAQDLLTKSISDQEQQYRTMFSGLESGAQVVALEGMRESLSERFAEDPMLKMAYDIVAGKITKSDLDIQFNINMALQSGQLNPVAAQQFFNSFASDEEATRTLNVLMKNYGIDATNEQLLKILNIENEELRKEAIINLIVNTSVGEEVAPETLLSLSPEGKKVQEEREKFEQNSVRTNRMRFEVGEYNKDITMLQGELADLVARRDKAEKEGREQDAKNIQGDIDRKQNYINQLKKERDDIVAEIAALRKDLTEAERAYQESLPKNYIPGTKLRGRSAAREFGTQQQRSAAVTEFLSQRDVSESGEFGITISIDYKGLSIQQLEQTNKNLETFNKFPKESLKIAGINAIGNPKDLADLTEKYEGFESTRTSVVRDVVVNVLGSRGVDAKTAIKQINDMGYSMREFAKLDNVTKYNILFNLEVEAKIVGDIANLENYMSGLTSPDRIESAQSRLQGLKNSLGDIRDLLSGLRSMGGSSTPPPASPGPGSGSSGGGDKEKSIVEQLKEQAENAKKMFDFMSKISKNMAPAFKGFIAGPFAAEFIEYLKGQGEKAIKELSKNADKFKQAYKAFLEEQRLLAKQAATTFPLQLTNQLRQSRSENFFKDYLAGQGITGNDMQQQIISMLGPQASFAMSALKKRESKQKLNANEKEALKLLNMLVSPKNIETMKKLADEARKLELSAARSKLAFTQMGLSDKLSQALIAAGYNAETFAAALARGDEEVKKIIASVTELDKLEVASGVERKLNDMGSEADSAAAVLAAIPGVSEETKRSLMGMGNMALFSAEQIRTWASALDYAKTKQNIFRTASQMIADQIEASTNVIQRQIERINRIEIRPLQNQIKVIEKGIKLTESQIRGIGKTVRVVEKEIKDFEKSIKPLDKEIKNYEKQIKDLQKSMRPLEKENEALREVEKEINEEFSKREKALDQIEKVNARISAQQRAQLSMAQAIAEGDIYAVAAAMQQYRAEQAQMNAEQTRESLREGNEKRREEITKKIEENEKQIKNTNEQIEGIQERIEGIQGRIEKLQEEIESRTERIATLNDEIADLQEKIANEQERIAGIQDQIEISKEKQLALEEKIYKLQLLRSMLSTSEAIKEAVSKGDVDLVKFLQAEQGLNLEMAKGEDFSGLGINAAPILGIANQSISGDLVTQAVTRGIETAFLTALKAMGVVADNWIAMGTEGAAMFKDKLMGLLNLPEEEFKKLPAGIQAFLTAIKNSELEFPATAEALSKALTVYGVKGSDLMQILLGQQGAEVSTRVGDKGDEETDKVEGAGKRGKKAIDTEAEAIGKSAANLGKKVAAAEAEFEKGNITFRQAALRILGAMAEAIGSAAIAKVDTGGFNNALKEISGALKTTISEFSSTLSGTLDTILTIGNKFKDNIEVIEGVADDFGGIMVIVSDKFEEILQGVSDKFGDIGSDFNTKFQGLMKELVDNFGESIKAEFGRIVTALQTFTNDSDGLPSVLGRLLDALSGFVDSVNNSVGVLNGFLGVAIRAIEQAQREALRAISDATTDAKNAIAGEKAKKAPGSYAGGMIKGYAMGGKIHKYPMGGKIPYAIGGVAGDGARDSVNAMLTPGEFVVRKSMVEKYGQPLFEAINQGSFTMPRYNMPNPSTTNIQAVTSTANINAPVYNNYDMDFAIHGTNASADEIANKVMFKIKQVQNQGIRSNRGY